MKPLVLDFNTRPVNRRRETEDVYIGRGSIWGNPFTHIKDRQTKAEFVVATREDSIQAYKAWILKQPGLLYRLMELNGKRLGCFCKPQSCHGDVLVYLLRGLIVMLNTYKIPDGAIDWTSELRVKQLVFFADQEELCRKSA
jgi:hypothetical protein